MVYEKQHQLYQKFQELFPYEGLEQLSLEQYSNNNGKSSFTYWVEFGTKALGSIRGGSSYKFGIFRFNNPPKGKESFARSDAEYTWYASLGADTRDEAFARIKAKILAVARAAREGDYEAIDAVEGLWHTVKWKIAFLYSEERLITWYTREYLEIAARMLGMVITKATPTSAIQRFLIAKRGGKDPYEFNEELRTLIGQYQKEQKGFWWITARPDVWSYSSLEEGEEIEFSLYSENGHKSKIFKNFMAAKAGDPVIAYDATPTLRIMGIGEIAKEQDGKNIVVRMKKRLHNPVAWSDVLEAPELAGMELFKNPIGTIFRLSKAEYEFILGLIKKNESEAATMPGLFAKPAYTKADFLSEVFMSKADYDRLARLVKTKKNVILQGAPGVGKTFAARRLAYALMGEKDESRVAAVQFHQNYGYEDFIMGWKPADDGGFKLETGVFYDFCKSAAEHPDLDYFFIIDEINRGNLSKIFGELLQLIETDYRDMPLRLAYNKAESFSVPANVHIIGMMNTADRSLAMIDYALRRRFSFFPMKPGFESEGFAQYLAAKASPRLDALAEAVKELNETIRKDDSLGEGFCIGHSYLIGDGDFDDDRIASIVEFDLIPLVSEYWFDNEARLDAAVTKLRNVLI